jgi:glutathione synthase/RimK-type ligase-like ATP-grasp enzyme
VRPGRGARSGHRVNVAVVVEHRYLAQAQPAGLIAALRGRGVAVRVVDCDAHVLRLTDRAAWLAEVDLVVTRRRSTATLALAACAEAAGVPTINACAATEGVRNKAALAVVLAEGGVPCPSTLLGSARSLAAELRPEEYPVVLKPVFGDNGRGLRRVTAPAHMRAADWPQDVALAQCYLPSDGRDLKLYAIGDSVFAVRKPSPFQPDGARVEGGAVPVPVTPALTAGLESASHPDFLHKGYLS